jgi:MoxR-like ATPase
VTTTSPETGGWSALQADRLSALSSQLLQLRQELGRKVVGQSEVVRQILAAILSEGHCLVVGMPGLAKTLLIRSIAGLLSLEFKRIQFTPDLMPADITGATLIHREAIHAAEGGDGGLGEPSWRFIRGPIFANVVLADEINRTPPKTQSALMEAMEERQVTAAGRRMPLSRPFFVLATQNPIEHEGTYSLPVSQLDRFQLTIHIDYPSFEEEFRVVLLTTSAYDSVLAPIVGREDIIEAIGLARRVQVPERLLDYVARLVRRTRPASKDAPDFVREWISWGAGPRAVQAMVQAARAFAFQDGRIEVRADDIHEALHPTLRHRLVLTYHAEAEGIQPDQVVDQIVASMPDGLYRPPETTRPRRGLLARILGRT